MTGAAVETFDIGRLSRINPSKVQPGQINKRYQHLGESFPWIDTSIFLQDPCPRAASGGGDFVVPLFEFSRDQSDYTWFESPAAMKDGSDRSSC